MKKIIASIFFASVLISSGCNETTKDNDTTETKSKETAEAVYTCPMHPEVTSDKPGSCPKCNMDLEKKE